MFRNQKWIVKSQAIGMYIRKSNTTLCVRCGKKAYIIAKGIATFVGNFLLYGIPFMINLLMCNLLLQHKIFLFLPIYIIVRICSVLTTWSYNRGMNNTEKFVVNFDILDYIAPLSASGKYYPYFIGVLSLMMLVCLISFLRELRRE